jgi:hypothetical protein
MLNRSILITLSAVALALSASCSKDMAKSPEAKGEQAMGAAQNQGKAVVQGGSQVEPRKVIHTGSMTVEVEVYESARKKIEQMVKEAGGFIASSELHHSDGHVSSASLVLRVPAGDFAGSVAAIGHLGTVRHETTNAQDVTEEYVDLAARLRNSKRLEARLIELTATEVGDLVELLAVEKELARVRETVEQFEGQLRLLANNVDLATLSISLITRDVFEAQDSSLGAKAGRSLIASWNLLLSVLKGLFLLIVGALPWILPLGLVVLLLRRHWPRA